MSGGYSSSHGGRPEATPEQVLAMYSQGLPNALGVTFGGVPQSLQQLATGVAGANPIYTASGLQQLTGFGPQYQAAGADIANRQAGSVANLIGGEGGRAAGAASTLDRSINPEFYATRANVAGQANNLFSSIGGANLSPAEMAAAERAINQGNTATGNAGTVSNFNTVANAMNFGQYLRQKQALLGNTIGTVGGILPNLMTGSFNPVGLATGAGSAVNNFGLSQFNPQQAQGTALSPVQFGGQVLGGAFGYGNSPISESKDTRGGVSCCFIFMEAYRGFLPPSVRKCRDRYYKSKPTIALGYKRMAKVLVPLMKRYDLVRNLVWIAMVKPLTFHSQFVVYRNRKSERMTRKFWLTIWNILGKF